MLNIIQNIRKDMLDKDIVRGWIFVNIPIFFVPIFIALITGKPDIYTAILSYCYALLVVGFYLFFIHVTIHGNPENGNTIFGCSLFGIALIVILLFSYNSDTFITKFIDHHIATTIIIRNVLV